MQGISRKKIWLEQVENQMETKADKVMVDKLAVEAGSLEDKVTNLTMDMSEKKITWLRTNPFKKAKGQKFSGMRPTRKQRKGGSRSSQ